MKKITVLFCFQIMVSFMIHVSAKQYYVSNTGNDNAKGTSPESSFKTLERLNKVKLKPGDKVFFRAGDTFTGTLRVRYSGKKEKPIIFTSYGDGEKPIITGAITINNFVDQGDNIYTAECDKNIQFLFVDDKIMTIARYPNSDFLIMDGGGHDYLIDYDFPFETAQVKGATVRMRINNWQFEYRTVTEYTDYKLQFDSILHNRPDKINSCRKGWGYYLDNRKEFFDAFNEWYYSPEEKVLYLCRDSNDLSDNTIEASYIDNGIVLEKEVAFIEFQNIYISGQVKTGLHLKGYNRNIVIKDCEFSKIGILGIKAEKACKNIDIINNRFYDITGTGMRMMEVSNCKISNNTIKRIGLIQGYGVDAVNGAVGIVIENEERTHANMEELSHNNIIANNIIDSTGYMSMRMDGYNSICENNIMKNGLLTLNDGGLFHCWGFDTVYTFNNIIRNNIAVNCVGDTKGTPSKFKMNKGIYIDNKCKDIRVENNIVSKTSGGILLNFLTMRCIVKNNICYNNKKALGVSARKIPGATIDHVITDNIFFNTENLGHTIAISSHKGKMANPGIIDHNLYVSPNEKYHIQTIEVVNDKKSTDEFTLKTWQEEMQQDKNSKLFVPVINGKEYPVSEIYINETDKSKSFKLNPALQYVDLEGNTYKNEVQIDARQAKILFYRGQ